MKVFELIEKLQQLPKDYRVIILEPENTEEECSIVILGQIDDYYYGDTYRGEEPVVFVG